MPNEIPEIVVVKEREAMTEYTIDNLRRIKKLMTAALLLQLANLALMIVHILLDH